MKESFSGTLILICLHTSIGFQLFAQKFAPRDSQCLVFVGQDLSATGGLDEYTDGYSDHFSTPAGITVYTNLSPGDESYGYYNKGLDGLTEKANWGAGDCWADAYLQDSTYGHSVIAIGLSLVNHEKEISKGNLDTLIIALGKWIKSTNRPVFLRVGYEFDGWDWNHYSKKHYLKAWQRIHQVFRSMQVDNVAFVWQSKGSGTNQETLEEWYPGDDIVDWCGYSYFGQPDEQMLHFARKHNKPVFIAEATPVRQIDNLYFQTDLSNKATQETIWNDWFAPFFKTLEENQDVIKAFSYINLNWPSQPMWVANPTFEKVDARLQVNPFFMKKWNEEMKKFRYIQAHPQLFKSLESHSKN